MCQTVYARCFPDARHSLLTVESKTAKTGHHLKKWAYRDDEVGHITVLCDDLQPRDGIAVADDIVKYKWTILLDPFTDEFLLPAT